MWSNYISDAYTSITSRSNSSQFHRRLIVSVLVVCTMCIAINSLGAVNDPDVVLQGWLADPGKTQLAYYDFLLNGKNCELHIRSIRNTDHDAHSVIYPCKVLPDSGPLTPIKYGSSQVLLKLPEGNKTLYFEIAQKKAFLEFSLPLQPKLNYPRSYEFMWLPLPSGEFIISKNPSVYLRVNDLDCTFHDERYGSARCIVVYWSPNQIMFYLGNEFFPQNPTPVSNLYVVKQPTGWSMNLNISKPPPPPPPTSRKLALNDHRPPIFAAIDHNDMQWIKDLLTDGADVNTADGNNHTPLTWSILNHRPAVALFLIEHGAHVNSEDKYGNSALEMAIFSSNRDPDEYLEVIKSLIAHGADVNHQNKRGIPPLTYAVIGNHEDIAKILIAHGARQNAKTKLAVTETNNAGYPGFAVSQKMIDLLNKHGANIRPKEGALDTSLVRINHGITPGTVMLVGQPGAAISGETVMVANAMSKAHASANTDHKGGFKVQIPGSAGDLYAVQLAEHGISWQPVYLQDANPTPELTVEPFNNGETTVCDDIVVKGTYTGPPETSVMIGNSRASLYHGHFIATDVAIRPGAHKIRITALTLGGAKVERDLNLSCTSNAPVRLMGGRPYFSEAASLELRFVYQFMLPSTVRTLKISYLDKGHDDFVTSDPAVINAASVTGENPSKPVLMHTYPAPGIYNVKLTVIDDTGKVYTDVRPFVVGDPAQTDRKIQSLWLNFLKVLTAGNRDMTAYMLHAQKSAELSPVLDKIQNMGPGVVDSLSHLERSSIKNGKATYYLQRITSAGKQKKDWIYFIQYPDGLWRIEWIIPNF